MISEQKFQGSEIANWVIDKVKKYELLNASTEEEGDVKFVEQLLEHLPTLEDMEKIELSGNQKGHTDIYKVQENGHQFFVKVPYPNMSEDSRGLVFEGLRKQQERAIKYFSDYIPLTVLTERESQKREKEYLIIQDVGEGDQFKVFLRGRYRPLADKGGFDKPLTEKMRAQLEDIQKKMIQMYEETGFFIDLDFILDFENERVIIFDTDLQITADEIGHFKMSLLILENCFGIKVPEKYQFGLEAKDEDFTIS